MTKFNVGDRVQMVGVPITVTVLELGVCREDDDFLHDDEFGGSAETFRFADPETGEDDWAHSGEFELVTGGLS